jgi:hypothetical protein
MRGGCLEPRRYRFRRTDRDWRGREALAVGPALPERLTSLQRPPLRGEDVLCWHISPYCLVVSAASRSGPLVAKATGI